MNRKIKLLGIGETHLAQLLHFSKLEQDANYKAVLFAGCEIEVMLTDLADQKEGEQVGLLTHRVPESFILDSHSTIFFVEQHLLESDFDNTIQKIQAQKDQLLSWRISVDVTMNFTVCIYSKHGLEASMAEGQDEDDQEQTYSPKERKDSGWSIHTKSFATAGQFTPGKQQSILDDIAAVQPEQLELDLDTDLRETHKDLNYEETESLLESVRGSLPLFNRVTYLLGYKKEMIRNQLGHFVNDLADQGILDETQALEIKKVMVMEKLLLKVEDQVHELNAAKDENQQLRDSSIASSVDSGKRKSNDNFYLERAKAQAIKRQTTASEKQIQALKKQMTVQEKDIKEKARNSQIAFSLPQGGLLNKVAEASDSGSSDESNEWGSKKNSVLQGSISSNMEETKQKSTRKRGSHFVTNKELDNLSTNTPIQDKDIKKCSCAIF